jgi:hypothetical protein
MLLPPSKNRIVFENVGGNYAEFLNNTNQIIFVNSKKNTINLYDFRKNSIL